MISKYISLLLYLIPCFLQGMGDWNGFELALASPDMPVADSILVSNDGGMTMSFKALRSVVRTWPLSSISSKS